eukprot:1147342-Pelagomonas_calceolata.AAC.4
MQSSKGLQSGGAIKQKKLTCDQVSGTTMKWPQQSDAIKGGGLLKWHSPCVHEMLANSFRIAKHAGPPALVFVDRKKRGLAQFSVVSSSATCKPDQHSTPSNSHIATYLHNHIPTCKADRHRIKDTKAEGLQPKRLTAS